MIVLSLNEIHSGAKKAARGAGYPWGLAEEAGQAVRWLCSQGLDGCAALAGILKKFDGAQIEAIAPQTDAPIWQARGGMLCPLVVGSAISDRADELVQRQFKTASIAQPVLLCAFAASAARRTNNNVSIEWPGGGAVSDGVHLAIHGEPRSSADFVNIRSGGIIDTPRQFSSRAAPKPGVWRTLNSFAHRTFAPATEESRIKGAGAEMNVRDRTG